MFRYKIVWFLLFVFIGIIVVTRPERGNRDLTRRSYEKFILAEGKNIPLPDNSKTKPDNPAAAAFQEYIMTLDVQEKRVPKERLYRALENIPGKTAHKRSGEYHIVWNELPADMGGRTRLLFFDPNDNQHKKAWVGSVTGGLWYTQDITDSNTAWNKVDDFWPSLSVSCMVADPKNPQIFYIGTGEAETALIIYRESSARGLGIWKSTDGGQNWTLLKSTGDFAYITDLASRVENDTAVIYAAVVSGTYMGQDHKSKPTDGLYRSKDGGQSWEQLLPFIPGNNSPFAPSDIEIMDNGNIFVGTMKNLNGKGGANILYSPSGDKGSWSVIDKYEKEILQSTEYPVPGRIKIASSPSQPSVVYAIIGSGYNSGEGFNYSYGNYFIRSSDGGKTWYKKNTPPIVDNRRWASLSWHAFSIAVNPQNSQQVFITGLDLYRTSDGGTTWARLSDWAGMYNPGSTDYVHADIHQLVFRPGSSSQLALVTDGGVFYTRQADKPTPVFYERNKGYNTLQFYSCDMHPMPDSAYYIGGLQDNGSLLYDQLPANVFDMISGGDGAYCFFDRNEPGLFFTSVYYNRYYIFNNWQYSAYIGNFYSGTFINPIDYDYRNNTIYGNACGFNGSRADNLLRITNIDGSYRGQYLYLGTFSNIPFSHVRVSPYSKPGNTVLFVGSQSGRIFRVEHVESSPQSSDITGKDFPVANISCIALGGSEDTLLVTCSNYGASSVWLTVDGGINWEEKENNLPDIPVRWALIHPQNTNQALLATETGIWSTTNLLKKNTEWTVMNEGMANVRIDMLRLREADLTVLAATHGRGLYTAKYELAKDVLTAGFTAGKLSLQPGDSVNFSDHSLGNPVQWKWYFEGAQPRESTDQHPTAIVYPASGEFDVTLVVSDSTGNRDSLTRVDYISVKPVSVHEETGQQPFLVYPVPATDRLFIKAAGEKPFSISVIALDGKVAISSFGEGFVGLDISRLRKGVYLVVVENNDEKQVRKLIVR